MVSRTRARSKSKGKRRAISPASSVSSNNTIGNEFVASTTKRIKTEPPEEFPPTTTDELIENNSPILTPLGAQRRCAPSGYSAALDVSPENHDDARSFEAPANLLYILSTGGTASKKFQGRLEEVVDDAFKSAPRSENDPPGLGYIERIIETLERNETAAERVVEVKTLLIQVWRHKMAEHLGRMITSSDELRETLNAVVGALPFQPGHNGFIYHCVSEPATTQGTATDVRVHTTEESTGKGNLRASSPSKRAKREPSEGGTAVHVAVACLPNSESQDQASSTGNCRFGMPKANTAEKRLRCDEPASHGASSDALNFRERPVPSFKERFPQPFDLFLHHVEAHPLFTAAKHRDGPEEDERLRRRAKAIFETMSSEERHRWRRIHKQILKGDSVDLDEAASRVLLAEQHIVEEPGAEPVFIKNRKTSQNRKTEVDPGSMQALMIPFITKDNLDTTRRVMFIINTPDMASIDTSQGRITNACWKAFGNSGFLQVEEWTKHVWVASFATFGLANKVKGTSLNLNGVLVQVEHLYPKPPSIFICDVTDIDLSDDEIAFRIAQAFGKGGGKPTLRMLESHKLYRGRYLWISLPRAQRLVRFYIRMIQRNSDCVHLACFRPVNHVAPCALCGYQHGTRPCESSRLIELP